MRSVVELREGGQGIEVTADNRIEYAHLMADYRLNKQVRARVWHARACTPCVYVHMCI